jgi:hypothetical protein
MLASLSAGTGETPPMNTPDQLKAEHAERYNEIVAIINRGNIARFWLDQGRWKDVNNPQMDSDGDMLAFRVSEVCYVPHVCWYASDYGLTEISVCSSDTSASTPSNATLS